MSERAASRWNNAEVVTIGGMRTELLELGTMVVARHTLPRGFDSAPLYRGLPDDMCPCEHWCHLVSGRLEYRFADGGTQVVGAGDAFHLRRGHLAEVHEDALLIEFTPAEQYQRKAEHLAARAAERWPDAPADA